MRAAVARLACAGRMAFTCYGLETLVCTTVFYWHGLGYFGSVGCALLAPWWLARFRFGPLESLWRTLT